MTYCLAVKINAGLVFCSDSRTNAGPDRVSAFSKMHRLTETQDRHLYLLSAGNLATTQAVIDEIERDSKDGTIDSAVGSGTHLADIADYIGTQSLKVQKKYAPAGEEAGFNAAASFILGGQIKGDEPELYLIYPEGNHIRTSEQYPFFQIGETKYGKPILDRIIDPDTEPEIAMRCALVSMDSTVRSNATVGAPIELMFYRRDGFGETPYYRSFPQSDSFLLELRDAWNEAIVQAFNALPAVNTERITDL